MRTTVTFDADTAAAVDRLRRETGLGLSDAVNELIRRGLVRPSAAAPVFRQQTRGLGLKVDVSNVADALEVLDGADAR
jgi:hypothetical protein